MNFDFRMSDVVIMILKLSERIFHKIYMIGKIKIITKIIQIIPNHSSDKCKIIEISKIVNLKSLHSPL
jgi:hypothetical protein